MGDQNGLTPESATTDPYLMWCERNRHLFHERAGCWIAYNPDEGIVVSTPDEDAFHRILATLDDPSLRLTHASLYGEPLLKDREFPPHRIREFRDRLGLTATDFADMLGCSAGAVSRWESHEEEQARAPGPEYAAKLRRFMEQADLAEGFAQNVCDVLVPIVEATIAKEYAASFPGQFGADEVAKLRTGLSGYVREAVGILRKALMFEAFQRLSFDHPGRARLHPL